MSGGHFDYKQYQIDEIADNIERVLNKQGKEKSKEELYGDREYFEKYPEERFYDTYPEIVQEKMREAVKQLKIAAVYAQRVDWFLSGDDAEESFIKRLSEDLNALNNKFINNNMTVINKTPHAVHIVDENNQIVKTYEKGETQVRLSVKTVETEPLIDGTPTTRTVFGEPEGLPDFQEGVLYIVSQLVKNALPNRKDLLVPAEVVRDVSGNIIGCKSLGR